MKVQISKAQGQLPDQKYTATIIDADDGKGGKMNIGCGFADSANQALLVAGAEMAERDLPIFGTEILMPK